MARPSSPPRPPPTVPLPVRRASLASLGTKLALANVCVLAVVSTLLFFELTRHEWTALVAAKTQAASMVADLFAATVAAPLDFVDTEPDELEAELAYLGTNRDVACAAVWDAARGRLVAELGRETCGPLAMPTDAELGRVIVAGDRARVARVVRSPRRTGAIGRTLLVFSLAEENVAFRAGRARIFGLSFALAAGTAGLLIAITRRQIVAPLGKLTRAARRIGRGELGGSVDVRSQDEIGELAWAFNRMSLALADREQRLESARQELRDLFDHMRQAIFAFGPDGRVVGATSRQATRLFGRPSLEGIDVRHLLYGAAEDLDAQAFGEWVAMAFSMPPAGWDEFALLAPRELVITRDGRPVPLEIEARPIVKDGTVERVMILATDVSETRALERVVQTQEEEHARRMAAMQRLVAGGGQVFVQFMETARERLQRCRALVGLEARTIRSEEIDELFRHVHTIKGEARAFDLRELEAETSTLERELDELRSLARKGGFAATGSVHNALVARLARASDAIEQGAEAFVAASPVGRAALNQVTVQRPDVANVMALAEARGDADLLAAVARLAARPLGESTASLIDMAPTWGNLEHKRVHLDVEGREVRVPPKLARVLGAALTHLVRNAIAHGIETPDVRKAGGKPPVGRIRIQAVRSGEEAPTIVVEDDGRGLDLAALAERAAEIGVAARGTGERERAELAFVAGLTTSGETGALAGRGVGLGAVRDDLAGAGYAVDVASQPGQYTRITLRPRGAAG